MKKALLSVSFGTTAREAYDSCIRPIENALQAACPDRELHRAFTSRMILQKLRKCGETAGTVSEALMHLHAGGFEDIAVAPLFVIPGGEYERLCADAKGCRIAEPLLHGKDDLHRIAALLAGIAADEGHPLLMLGHGTDHAADNVYAQLREILPGNVFLACMEGEHRLEPLLPELEALPEKQLTAMPLMLTAGIHARTCLTSDAHDSWKTLLESRGFDLRVRMQGMGSLETVQQMFAEKLQKIL